MAAQNAILNFLSNIFFLDWFRQGLLEQRSKLHDRFRSRGTGDARPLCQGTAHLAAFSHFGAQHLETSRGWLTSSSGRTVLDFFF